MTKLKPGVTIELFRDGSVRIRHGAGPDVIHKPGSIEAQAHHGLAGNVALGRKSKQKPVPAHEISAIDFATRTITYRRAR